MQNKYTKRQMEILKITIDFVSRKGLRSFTLRKIAKEVGIKEPTLYDHFKSKEKILEGIFDIYKSEIHSYHQYLASLDVPVLTKIKMYFKKMSELIQYKPGYMNLVMFEFYQYRDIFENDLTFLLESMKNIIKDSSNNSDSINYEWVIIQIYGVLHYFLKNKLLSEKFDVLTSADSYWDKLEATLKNKS